MSYRIILALPRSAAFLRPIEQALVSMQHQVKTFDYQTGNVITRAVGLTANTLGLAPRMKSGITHQIQRQLLRTVRTFKPHLFLTIKGESLTRDTISEITRSGVTTINWYPDWLDSWEWVKENAHSYSLFASCCLNLYQKLKRMFKRTIYLPYAANPDSVHSSLPKRYLISFVGQYTKRREKFFQAIQDLGLNIWGYYEWQTSPLKHLAQPPISPQKTLAVFRQSKIVVNILTGTDSFQPSAVNNRTFETLGVGTFLLVQDHPILYRHFSPGKEFITFKSPTELRQQVHYYLTHDKEREQIATCGWRQVQQEHTYVKRLQELFNHLKL